MTKKDFELIARTIRAMYEGEDCESHEYVAETFCAALRETNPRFDAGRFLSACGLRWDAKRGRWSKLGETLTDLAELGG